MAVSPDASLFVQTNLAGQRKHNNYFIADDIVRMIRCNEKAASAGIVVENTSVNEEQ